MKTKWITSKILIINLLFFIGSQKVMSQIVNIENKRIHQSDTTGLFGHLYLGLNLVENGNTIFTFRSGGQAEWLKDKNLWLSTTDFNLIKVNENEFVNNGFQHLRYNRKLNKKWTYEAFGQIQFNERTRIKLRALLGTGIRITLVEKDEIKDTTIVHRDQRLSSYLSFHWQPNKNITFSGTSYYQPILTEFSNIRLSSSTGMQLKITDKLSFKTTFQITFDGQIKRDTPEITDTIYSLVNGIRWDF